ncbi:hypothetical protein LY632_12950 [Erythrobacter sp. SDW2]|uniref:hypothetical protein n=1 Tax=Erythrobacter sp. SDW2 TaxID=2907154 RepID=UPI001F344C50|nr:hypothetical protein [Erythrobacter sp. SDW2]UIP06582.1 hypothetical protein LY632_12950 [Erythrobacter sp. SDW2]
MQGLARVKDGYQLWHESRSGLYFLTAHSEPLGRRPDFSDFLDRTITDRADISPIERLLAGDLPELDLRKQEVSAELMHEAVSLSQQLGMRVLVAEDTDDEYGMAVLAENGTVHYLRLRTTLKDAPGDECRVEVVYRPEIGFEIDSDPAGEIYGLAQTAIDDAFGVAGLNLVNFSDSKPTRDQAKRRATGEGVSISAYLDSYGVFERISHGRPQRTTRDKLLLPFRILMTLLILPFFFVGLMAWAIFFAGRPGSNGDINENYIVLIGVAVLALPIWGLVRLVGAMLGN